jgi:DNA-binding beta-propeller fold protein YncE
MKSVAHRWWQRGVLLAVGLILGGCGGKHTSSVALDSLVVFPPPPDTARIQFLTRITSASDLREAQSRSFLSWLVGESEVDSVSLIVRPYGLAVSGGKIYVCDLGLPGLEVLDLEERTLEHVYAGGPERLGRPANCHVDDAGNLYVADLGLGEVLVLDSAGTYQGSVGSDSVGQPGDVFVTEDRIWISDYAVRGVRVFDRASREYLYSFPDGVQPRDPGGLARPANLYVWRDEVYVSDQLCGKVEVYSTDGSYLRTIGARGTGFGQFSLPKGVAVDEEGLVYVVDARFENVQIFDREGQLLTFFGGPYRGPGYMSLPAKVIVDYAHLDYFRQYVHPQFELQHLIFVTNQSGPDRISVYGFVQARD